MSFLRRSSFKGPHPFTITSAEVASSGPLDCSTFAKGYFSSSTRSAYPFSSVGGVGDVGAITAGSSFKGTTIVAFVYLQEYYYDEFAAACLVANDRLWFKVTGFSGAKTDLFRKIVIGTTDYESSASVMDTAGEWWWDVSGAIPTVASGTYLIY